MSEVILLPNKKLRQRSEEVVLPLNAEDEKIAKELIEYLDDSQQPDSEVRAGVGIAAVQLGYLKRMFYVNLQSNDDREEFRELLINPQIIAESETYAAISTGEGCLSIDYDDETTQGLVHRKLKIVIKGYSYFSQKEVTITKVGYPAIVLQHEFDHLNGVLFIDRINRKDPWTTKESETLI